MRYNGTIYPVSVSIMNYESEAIAKLPEGNFYADAAYDNKTVLNTIVGYNPIVK